MKRKVLRVNVKGRELYLVDIEIEEKTYGIKVYTGKSILFFPWTEIMSIEECE